MWRLLKVIRPKPLSKALDVGLSTIYDWENRGILPPRRRIGPNTSGWPLSELLEWLESRPRESCLSSAHLDALMVGGTEYRERELAEQEADDVE